MAMILGRILCFLGLHNYKVYLKAKAKLVHVNKSNKHYHSLRYDIYQIHKCDKCNKIHFKVKVRSNLKELQAKMYMQNY